MPAMDLHAQRRLFEVPRDGRRLVVDADADAVTAVAELIDQHELRTPYRVGPRPLETCLHEDTSGGRVLFIINPSKAALEATVELGTSTSLVDLLNGERYSGMSSVRVPVDGWTCRMFEVVIAASEDSGSGEAVAS